MALKSPPAKCSRCNRRTATVPNARRAGPVKVWCRICHWEMIADAWRFRRTNEDGVRRYIVTESGKRRLYAEECPGDMAATGDAVYLFTQLTSAGRPDRRCLPYKAILDPKVHQIEGDATPRDFPWMEITETVGI